MCKCSQENCNLEVFESRDKCILHCEKDDWYEVDDNGNKNWDNKKIKFFWNQIQKDLNDKYQESFYEPEVINEIYIYDNVVFVKFQEDVIYNKYEDNQDKLGTNFYSHNLFKFPDCSISEELNQIISKLNVSFENCKFLDNVDLSRYHFEKKLKFKKCKFEENLILKRMILKNNLEFHEVKIKGRLDLSNTIFEEESKVRVKNCEIGNAYFNNTKFRNLADFFQTIFHEVNFEKTDFEKIAVFSESEFNCNVNFKYTKFLGKSIFQDTVIKGKLNLRNTIFNDEANFLDITSIKRDKKEDEFIGETKEIKVSNRETARIIKNFFDNTNNTIEANKFYKLEMEERRKEFKDVKDKNDNNNFEKFVFFIHRYSSNHSQSWILSLFWIVSVTYIASMTKFFFLNDYCKTELLIKYEQIDIYNFFINDKLIHEIVIGVFIVFFTLVLILSLIKKLDISGFLVIVFIILSLVYTIYTKDYLLIEFSNTINPFSIMTGKEELTFGILLYKITIAYLIYQLIISIRQNTRRK